MTAGRGADERSVSQSVSPSAWQAVDWPVCLSVRLSGATTPWHKCSDQKQETGYDDAAAHSTAQHSIAQQPPHLLLTD